MSVGKGALAHEVAKFRKVKDLWWTHNGALRSLHQFNPIRVEFIQNSVANFCKTDTEDASLSATAANVSVLSRKSILDVGCGGGILSETLARLGGKVTGIDACKESIMAANCRKEVFDPSSEPWVSQLNFQDVSLFDLADQKAEYDVVVASEVIEHVDDARTFFEALTKVTKPGGVLVLSTMDKSIRSAIMHIGLGEYLTGIVPRGTHDWAKFIPPKDVTRFAAQLGMTEADLQYVFVRPSFSQSLASRQLQLKFSLTKKVNTGQYFWAGVKAPARAS